MAYKLDWLEQVLLDAGLKVAPVQGWLERGHGDMGEVMGVMCHHTGGPPNGNMASLDTVISGRPDLSGPLAQLALGRDGGYYVIAAGRCYHAGEGIWQGIRYGNSCFIGIEAENTGRADDPWPHVQIDAYQRGVAAILKRLQRNAMYCVGHKEYALPKGRKPDPAGIDMDDFRRKVGAILDGTAPAPVLIPRFEQLKDGNQGRPTIRRGASGPLVEKVQTRLQIFSDGLFGSQTEAAVRAFQRSRDLVPDGIIGPKTWQALGPL